MRFSRNKKINVLVALGMAVVMLAMSVTVYAAGERKFLKDYTVEEDDLQILIAADDEEGGYRQDGFSLSLSGQEIPVTGMTSVGEAGLPRTIYCLVDVSGSMSGTGIEWIKQVLNVLADNMNEQDNMVIGTLGNTTATSGFMTDRDDIAEAIDALAVGNEDTNLYSGIVDSLALLDTDGNAHQEKCLLIFSDGKDDQKSGITQGEAENAVIERNIPVYTVAVLHENASADEDAYAKLLGSFARMSTGGKHYVADFTQDGAEQTGADITAAMENSVLLHADVSQIQPDKDIMLLRVTYTSPNGSSYEDTMEIYGEELAGVAEQQTEQTTEEIQSTDTTTGETTETIAADYSKGKSSKKSSLFVIISIVAILLIGSGAAVLVVLRRKKKAGEADEAAVCVEETQETVMVHRTGDAEESKPEHGDAEEPETFALKLMAIGYEDISHTLLLVKGKETTIGRNSQADVVLRSEDKKLSSVHCILKWEDGKIYLTDADSTNGTFVNGVPIKQMGRVVVHKGDTVRIGSYEYRIC